jgi:hypothetical protein
MSPQEPPLLLHNRRGWVLVLGALVLRNSPARQQTNSTVCWCTWVCYGGEFDSRVVVLP